jgi:hypothetical protein
MMKCKCCGILVEKEDMTTPKLDRCKICNKFNSYFSNHKLKGRDHILKEIIRMNQIIKDCELKLRGWENILNGTPVYKAIKPLAQEEWHARYQNRDLSKKRQGN